MSHDDPMPKPEPVWIALAIVIWALAEALGHKRRPRFIAALDRLAADHGVRRRIVALYTTNGRRRAVSASVEVAVRYIARILVELRGAR